MNGLRPISTIPLFVGACVLFLGAAAPGRLRGDASDISARDERVRARNTKPVASARERFSAAADQEIPDFRRHVAPLLGRLGCNGRSCHGSFQGQGGFRLSLFGYDFHADHAALVAGDSPRVDTRQPLKSLLLDKPTQAEEHGGGQRMKAGSWPYELLRRWIEIGAPGVKDGGLELQKLETVPAEIAFENDRDSVDLQVIATWSDGWVEDVTPLCRFQVNDESIADVDENGAVTSKGAGDTHVIVFYDGTASVAQVLRPVSRQFGARYPEVTTTTQVDALIVAKLRKLGIVPSELCSDTEFLRRISLDMTGTLPTPEEIECFSMDPSPAKRAAKIDELLERETYVARWTTRLCELVGNNPRHFQDLAPPEEYARHWYEWITRRVRENVPYDELVTGIILGRSRLEGESYDEYIARQSSYYREHEAADFTALDNMPYYWAKRTSRTPEERALNFSYAFLGVRIECAQCHKHPFDRWTQDDFKSFTALFEPVGFGIAPDGRKTHQQLLEKLNDKGNQAQRVRARLERAQRGEVVPWPEVFVSARGTRVENGKITKVQSPSSPRVLGGANVDVDRLADPRLALVSWIRDRENPYFARVFVNRVWAEYFGTGIIHPPDDMNLANPPSHPELLDYLVNQFVERGFDMKWLHREITNSHAYQRSIKSNESNRWDERNFSRAVARRMPAEVLLDAIEQATARKDDLEKWVTQIEDRAIGPRGGALVGRFGDGRYAPVVFGRSPRDTNCDCSASNEPNLLQAIYLQNDKDMVAAMNRKNGWITELILAVQKSSRGGALVDRTQLVEEAFLRTLSRPPTAAETDRCLSHLDHVGEPIEGMKELVWALLNTREFVTNH